MKTHTNIRTCRSRARKFKGHCEECQKEICSCKAYQYVDESNAAISNNSPYLCKSCYEKKYNVHIPTDIERFKNNLISTLQQIQYNYKVDTIRIDKIIEYITNTD